MDSRHRKTLESFRPNEKRERTPLVNAIEAALAEIDTLGQICGQAYRTMAESAEEETPTMTDLRVAHERWLVSLPSTIGK